MKDTKTTSVYIKGVPRETHAIIKGEAARRGIKESAMYIKAITSGIPRLRMGAEGK